MKIAKYLFIVLLMLFVTNQVVSMVMDRLYKSVYIGMSGGKINYLLDHFKHVSILSIGDSRCAHHVIPGIISDDISYNLSHNGMSLNFHTGLIDQLINNEEIKIDTILLHLEVYEIFNPDDQKSRDIQHLKYYYNKNKWIRKEIAQLSKFESVKYLLPSYKWNGKIISILSNKYKMTYTAIPKDGYVKKPPTSRDSINVTWSYNKRKNKVHQKYDKINADFQSNIAHIKNLCDKNGIKLICFTSPIFKPDDTLSGDRKVKIQNYFSNIDVLFLDYSDEYYLNPDLQSIWNWTDEQHMNQKGAVIFTQILKSDLKKMGSVELSNH